MIDEKLEEVTGEEFLSHVSSEEFRKKNKEKAQNEVKINEEESKYFEASMRREL